MLVDPLNESTLILNMGKFDHAKCPKCGKEAHNRTEVDDRFGIRNNSGYVMVQSWCKECRS